MITYKTGDLFSEGCEACKRDEVQPGHMFVYETGQLMNPRYIIDLSTVHWVVTRKQPRCADDVVMDVYNWNDRKRQFSERQVHLALEVLSRKGWCKPLSGAEA